MIEELPDDIENDVLDDIEPVGDESQLYEHFRVVVDKGQEMMRVDKYLFESKVDGRETHRSWGAKTILSLRLTPHQLPLLFRTSAPGYSKSPLTR